MKRISEKSTNAVRALWEEGFFKSWRKQIEVEVILSQRGSNFPKSTLRTAMTRAPYLLNRKIGGFLEYVQKRPAISKEMDIIETELFEDGLKQKFGSGFAKDISDLQLNFNRSGNCTAFLLRKILEKLIYKVFAKNGLQEKLIESDGKIVGLERMIKLASQEQVGGLPLLRPQTAREIRGIKFLGDVSAHNPLIDVDMKTIIPQMPFIITAYKELLR